MTETLVTDTFEKPEQHGLLALSRLLVKGAIVRGTDTSVGLIVYGARVSIVGVVVGCTTIGDRVGGRDERWK